jgi:hypothetical protein
VSTSGEGGVFVPITIEDDGASDAVTDLNERLSLLEQAFIKSSAAAAGTSDATKAVGESANVAAGGIAKAGESAVGAAAAFDGLTKHSYLVTRGLSAAGLAGEAAALKIAAASDALKGLAAANPIILAVVAALATLVGGFMYLKSAVDEASKVQSAMEALRIVIEQDGGAWSEQESKIRSWAAALSEASGTPMQTLIADVLRLRDAGQSVDAAMTIVTVSVDAVAAGMGRLRGSTDLAASSQQRLNQFVQAYTQATGGNVAMLGNLDAKLKPLIADHASLSKLTAELNNETKNAIAENHANALAWQQVNGVMGVTKDRIGQEMLPALTMMAHALFNLVDTLGHVEQAWEDWVHSTWELIKGLAMAVIHFSESIADAIQGMINGGDFGNAYAQLKAAGGEIVASGHAIGEEFKDMGKIAWDATHMGVIGTNDMADALRKLALVANATKGIVENATTKPKGGGGTGYVEPASGEEVTVTQRATQATKEYTAAQEALTAAKTAGAARETELEIAVKEATTQQGKAAAEAALATAKTNDLAQQYDVLKTSIATESRTLVDDEHAVQTLSNAHAAATTKIDGFEAAADGAKKQTLAWKERHVALTAAVHNTESALKDAESGVRTLTGAIKEQNAELSSTKDRYHEAAAAAAEAYDAIQLKWNTFVDKELAGLNEERDTYSKTQSEKIEYYANFVATTDTMTEQSEERKEGYFQKELDAYKSMVEQELEARKAEVAQEEQVVSSFLNDLIDQHKSFAEAIKSILADMEKNYVDAFSKAWIGSMSPGSQSAFGALLSPGTSSAESAADAKLQTASATLQTSAQQLGTAAGTQLPNAATQLGNAATALDNVASKIGSGGGTGSSSPWGLEDQNPDTYSTSSGQALVVYQAGADAQTLTSQFNAASPTLGSASAAASIATGVNPWTAPLAGDPMASYALAASGVTNMGWNAASAASIPSQPWGIGVGGPSAPAWGWGQAPGTPPAASPSWMTQGMGYLGEGLMGYGIGSSVNSYMNPNELPGQSSGTWAGLLGGAGDIGGTMVGGPVGGMIGALLGGLVGSLFGSHETPAQEPDVSEPTYGTQWSYGQFVSNMIGSYGTYNGQYVAAQQPYNTAEGGVSMGDQITQELKSLPKNLSPVIEGLAGQLRALEQGDTNANALAIKSESQGMFTLESGATVSVQSYMQMVSQFMNATAGMVPTFQLSRAYPNLNKSTLLQTGEYDPTLTYGPASGVPGSTPPPYYGQPGSGQQQGGPGPVKVDVNVRGIIVSSGDISDKLAVLIAQALQRLNIGTGAGQQNNRLGSGVSGGDWQ